ncbi:MAG: hydrogenase maturation nickel metallochaperone HypA [Desulfomicrobium escambiense]|nr:hydrogenase maturation nickel metallochaperone HypA [Desulfomicrobium escambiense]
MAGVSEDALRRVRRDGEGNRGRGIYARGGEGSSSDSLLRLRLDSNPADFVFLCPECGSRDVEILAGREMEVDYILVGDGAAESDGSSG